jgi:hypothetical protein
VGRGFGVAVYTGGVNLISTIPDFVMLAATVAAVGIKAFAVVAALSFTEQAYAAAAKLTKVTWGAILGVALVAQLVISYPLHLLNIVGLVAAFVFLADVRPALREVTRR